MKGFCIFFILVYFSLDASGQTLQETRDWIADKIEAYAGTYEFNSDPRGDLSMQTTSRVSDMTFNEEEMIINTVQKNAIKASNVVVSFTRTTNTTIPISQIKKIGISNSGITISTNKTQIIKNAKISEVEGNDEALNNFADFRAGGISKDSSFLIEIDFTKEAGLLDKFKEAVNRLGISPAPKK